MLTVPWFMFMMMGACVSASDDQSLMQQGVGLESATLTRRKATLHTIVGHLQNYSLGDNSRQFAITSLINSLMAGDMDVASDIYDDINVLLAQLRAEFVAQVQSLNATHDRSVVLQQLVDDCDPGDLFYQTDINTSTTLETQKTAVESCSDEYENLAGIAENQCDNLRVIIADINSVPTQINNGCKKEWETEAVGFVHDPAEVKTFLQQGLTTWQTYLDRWDANSDLCGQKLKARDDYYETCKTLHDDYTSDYCNSWIITRHTTCTTMANCYTAINNTVIAQYAGIIASIELYLNGIDVLDWAMCVMTAIQQGTNEEDCPAPTLPVVYNHNIPAHIDDNMDYSGVRTCLDGLDAQLEVNGLSWTTWRVALFEGHPDGADMPTQVAGCISPYTH